MATGLTKRQVRTLPREAPAVYRPAGRDQAAANEMSAEYAYTVIVGDEPCVVRVHQKTKRVWIAVGDYMGERIEAKGSGRNSALAAWRQAARHIQRIG
jgi:hypothetical protein